MQTVHKTPAVTATARKTRELDADLLVIPVFADDNLADEPDLDRASGGEYAGSRQRREFGGKPFEQLFTPLTGEGWKARRALWIGAGSRADVTTEMLRRIATMGGLFARQRRLGSIAIVWRGADGLAPDRAAQALAEGAVLANYEGTSYKTAEEPVAWLERVEVRTGEAPQEAALERGRVLGECTNMARALSNEPGNVLTPREFAERAATLAKAAGVAAEVLDEKKIAELKMGLLLGVARGSEQPPRLIVLRHEPKRAVKGVVLGLVGKGITFDTGGISIKPSDNMDKMKDDMSGGAAVVCAMAAMARLEVPVRCIGVIPATENMPGGRAMKPGDILTSAEGKTVEVINTDAEGRLILGDGLWYAQRLGATHLVDVATLTGAAVVALGKVTAAIFGQPESWVRTVREAALGAGDRCWPMPLYDEYAEQLKSDIADMMNTGGRPAGACTAAMFLKEFVGATPWAHLDVAGVAWLDEAKPWMTKGASGVAVRTLAELPFTSDTWA